MMESFKMITQSELKELLHYDPDTGIFTCLKSRGSAKVGDIAGRLTNRGYIQIKIKYKSYMAHRLAWLYMTGRWPEYDIDHKKHIKHDNRFSELREVTSLENCRNLPISKRNKSGITGVSWFKRDKKWHAHIKVNGKSINLGYFIDKWDAICARKSANNKYGFHKNHGDLPA